MIDIAFYTISTVGLITLGFLIFCISLALWPDPDGDDMLYEEDDML